MFGASNPTMHPKLKTDFLKWEHLGCNTRSGQDFSFTVNKILFINYEEAHLISFTLASCLHK